jgi:hypothetical protein
MCRKEAVELEMEEGGHGNGTMGVPSGDGGTGGMGVCGRAGAGAGCLVMMVSMIVADEDMIISIARSAGRQRRCHLGTGHTASRARQIMAGPGQHTYVYLHHLPIDLLFVSLSSLHLQLPLPRARAGPPAQ